MYISKIKLHNFKGFKGDHEILFDKGVNFLLVTIIVANHQFLKLLTLYAQKRIEVKSSLRQKLKQIVLFLLKLNSKVRILNLLLK